MMRIVMLAGVAVLVGGLMGCAYEKRVSVKEPGPPEWVITTVDPSAEVMAFKGMALMDNILDERTARNRALADARRQIAESLSSDIQANSVEIVTREGAEHKGEDETDQTFRDRLEAKAQAAVDGAREKDYYWEKWKIKEGLFSGAYSKYKYYVRVDVPRDLYEKLRKDLAAGR
jgi:hypothetical protein